MKTSIQFVYDEEELESVLSRLKQVRCPHCGRRETLNRHDRRYGNNLDAVDKQSKRGQRAWCNTRGRRGGCGRTVAILFVRVLPRHSVTAPLLEAVLQRLCAGGSIQAAWDTVHPPVTLESVYHLLQRFRQRLDGIRTLLMTRCRPPRSHHADPLRQTAEHLKCAFEQEFCPVAAFQYTFQRPLMG